MQSLAPTYYSQHRRFLAVGLLVLIGLAFSTSLAFAMGLFADIADPLPQGCRRPTPPGQKEPVCCLSGFVIVRNKAVKDAKVTVFDAQGEIGSATTQVYPGLESKPFYYFDLTKLQIRSLGATRPITPGDVITLVASYSGVTGPKVRYQVQQGGQNLDFNPYDATVLPLQANNPGRAEPGKFQRIGDVTIDAQGNLYLWDIYNSRMQVLRLDEAGTWLNLPDWQREIGSQPHQVYAINGLAVNNKTGHIYLADGNNNRIAIYTTDGDFTTKVISAAGGIASLDIDDAGNLYAYTYFEGIKKYNADGAVIARNTSSFLQWDTIGRNLTVSPQGDLFYMKDTTNTVVKFAPDLSTYITFTLQLTSGLPLTRPSAIMVDDTNTLFVFNNQKARLFAFDAKNGQARPNAWETLRVSPGSGKFLTSDQNYIYLISEYEGKIFQLWKEGGKPQKIWGGQTTNPGSISMPVNIAVAPDNSLWIADEWTSRISRMVNNEIKQSWPITEVGQLTSAPLALTFDHNGKLLIITVQGQLQRFRYENATLIADTQPWDSSTSSLGKLCKPSSIDVDKNDYIYITEYCNNRVQVLRQDPTTNSFTAITSLSALTATGSLGSALGIAVDDRVNPTLVYVGDGDHKRIVKLSFDGTVLKYVDSLGGPTRFSDVAQIAIDEQGFLWVADQFYRVHRINPNQLNDWRIYGSLGDPTWNAYGVAITKTSTTPPQPLLYVSSRAWGLISSFSRMGESDPVATIVHLSAEDLVPGETLTLVGSGQDGDATSELQLYEWTFISATNPVLTITSSAEQVTIPIVAGPSQSNQLGSGLYNVRLRVQDTEGAWSEPVSRTIYVAPRAAEIPVTPIPTRDPLQPAPLPPPACLAGGKWTLLLYLDADNSQDGADLMRRFDETIKALQVLNHPCVQVAVQLDGPRSIGAQGNISDTVRWLIQPNPGSTKTLTTTEAQMDTPEALSDFIRWGQGNLPADHYYLAIADHGNAYQGIAFDHTSWQGESWHAYLTASELSAALTAPGVLPIDILHLDACSMALLDVAYEVRDKVNYLIASQYIGWSYFAYADYASYMTQQSAPPELAKLIVERYANLATRDGYPYTISALDLTRKTGRIEPVKNAVDELAKQLKSWLNGDGVVRDRHDLLFTIVRNQSQFFDSNSNLVNTPRDAYVDLRNFVERIQQVGLTDTEASLTPDILAAANDVWAELNRPDKLVLAERHAAPTPLPTQFWQFGQAIYQQPIDLNNAYGLSIYYPAEGTDLLALPRDEDIGKVTGAAQNLNASTTLTYTQVYSDYIHNQLFTFTRATRWDEFLLAAYGEPPITATLATPPPPVAPLDPLSKVPPEQVRVRHNTQPHDNVIVLDTLITNNSAITLPQVTLVQPFTTAVATAEVITALAGLCPALTIRYECHPVGNIPPQMSLPVHWEVPLLSTDPLPPLLVYVNGLRQQYTSDQQLENRVYLPLIRK